MLPRDFVVSRLFLLVLCVQSSFLCGCEIVANVQTLKMSLLCGRVLFARFLSLFFAFYLFFSRFLISLFRIAVSSSVPSIFA